MLWKYAHFSDLGLELKSRKEAAIQQWWQDFTKWAQDNPSVSPESLKSLLNFMSTTLPTIEEQVCWEATPEINGVRILTLTAEGERQHRPMIESMVAMAPNVPGWRFCSYKEPRPLADSISGVGERTGLDLSMIGMHLKRESDNRIRIEFPGVGAIDACFLLSEYVLGEKYIDEWVGTIRGIGAPLDQLLYGIAAMFNQEQKQLIGHGKLIEPGELKGAFDAAVQKITDSLPQTPYWKRSDDDLDKLGLVYGGKPNQPASAGRPDLILGSGTFPPELLRAITMGSVSSCRFSLFGETFCYLKLTGTETLSRTPLERAHIEEALNNVLMKNELGRVLGGACGTRYAYIDIVLADVEAAIPLIRSTLSAFDLKETSWLLFHNIELVGEWVGIFKDSPPPTTTGRTE